MSNLQNSVLLGFLRHRERSGMMKAYAVYELILKLINFANTSSGFLSREVQGIGFRMKIIVF